MFLNEFNQQQQQAFICLAHNVVVSDGDLSPGEVVMMNQLKREIGLPEDFEPHYIAVEEIDGIFDSQRARVAVVMNLIRLGYADGAFEIEEQFLLKDVCRIFNIDEPLFGRIENWVRRLIALEEEAIGLF